MKRKTVVTATSFVLLAVVGYLWLTFWTAVDATKYAPGFSETKFKDIEKGMSSAAVMKILGEPLVTWDLGDVGGPVRHVNRWIYAYLDEAKIPDADDDRVTNTWFRLRAVEFDKSGRVMATMSSTEHFE